MLNTPIAPLQNTTDFTIAKNANQASMIDKTEPTVNKGVLKQMPNYFSLKDIQHSVPSYVKSSNNRKLKTQFRNALKQF